MSGVTLDWSSAEVRDRRLELRLRGELPRGWKQSFERTVALLDGGEWGKVRLMKAPASSTSRAQTGTSASDSAVRRGGGPPQFPSPAVASQGAPWRFVVECKLTNGHASSLCGGRFERELQRRCPRRAGLYSRRRSISAPEFRDRGGG
jgi:hypothetical protein